MNSDLTDQTNNNRCVEIVNKKGVVCRVCYTQKSMTTNQTVKEYSPATEYMDSACSMCMSGNTGRIGKKKKLTSPRRIVGFNDTNSDTTIGGINADGKQVLLVPGMPEDRDLLCAAEYAKDGPIVLFETGDQY